MFVTIIASHYCTVNRKNAIVLLTEYQKYYGEKLLYQRSTKRGWFIFCRVLLTNSEPVSIDIR